MKGIEAKLKAGFVDRADRLEAALAVERSKTASLQSSLAASQKAMNGLEAELEDLKASSSKTIAALTAALERAREQLAVAMRSEERLGTALEESKGNANSLEAS